MAEKENKRQRWHTVHQDGWENTWTGLGTSTDKTTQGQFLAVGQMSDSLLSALYHQHDVAQRIVDTLPNEMYRKGFSVEAFGEPEKDAELNAKVRVLNVRGIFQEACRWGRLFGGAAVIMGADDGQPAASPLVPERVRSVEWLRVADRREIQVLSFYETGAKAGTPETYQYTPLGAYVTGGSSIIHESRVIMFGGAPTGRIEKIQLGWWDYSVLQNVYEIMRSYDTGWKAVEHLLTDAHQAVFTMAGLASALESPEGTSAVDARMRLIDRQRSVGRPIVMDAGDSAAGEPAESFTRQSVSFAEIPAILDKEMLRLAQAAKMPVTILMGQSPAGMNATGESDFRWFYDQIETEQKNNQSPKIVRLVDVILRSKEFASPDLDVDVRWQSLWSETPGQQAATRKTIADADAVYINAGVLTPEEVTLSRFGGDGFGGEISLSNESLEARSNMLELELEKAEEEPEPPPVPMPPVVPVPPVPSPQGPEEAAEDD